MMIPGVRVCCKGTARGHDLTVDETLLSQLESELQRRGRTPVKLNHGGKLESVVGFLENPRLAGGKLLADLSLLKSSWLYEFAKDLIARFGTAIGLSCAFTGNAETLPDGRKAARCSELHSCDIVESPALGNGMFEAEFNGSLIQFEARPVTPTLPPIQSAEVRQLLNRVRALQIRFDAIQKRQRQAALNDDDDQPQGHDGGTSIATIAESGAIEGAGGALVTDALIHGKGTIAQRLAGIARDFKTPIESGLPEKLLIGGVAGGLLTAAAGEVVTKIAERRRKQQLQQQPTQFASRTLNPAEQRDRSLYRVSGFRHKNAEDEYDRAASNYIKSGAAGATAGALVGSLKNKAKVGGAIGALAGLGSVAAVRKLMPADDFGQRSPDEHHIERAIPVVGATVAAIAARKKIKQVLSGAADRMGQSVSQGIAEALKKRAAM